MSSNQSLADDKKERSVSHMSNGGCDMIPSRNIYVALSQMTVA